VQGKRRERVPEREDYLHCYGRGEIARQQSKQKRERGGERLQGALLYDKEGRARGKIKRGFRINFVRGTGEE